MKLIIDIPDNEYKQNRYYYDSVYHATPFNSVIEDIKAEIHATAEMHEDGDYYLRDEWIDEIIDKHISGKENE